jgi:hypothetical protein
LSPRERLFWLCAGAALIALVFSLVPSHYEICEIAEKTKEGHCTSYQVVPFVGIKAAQIIDRAGGIITALATIAIAIFTLTLKRATDKLWDAGEHQTNIARQAMIAGERAFVFATGIAPFWEIDPTTKFYNWRFRPNWKNSGDTPTRRMTMHSRCELRTEPLPEGFNFDYLTQEIGTALIPPNTEVGGGLAPGPRASAITAQDILDAQSGRKFLYFLGWARYFDVFPDTPQHITRFCWQILPIGDPFAYDPKVSPQNLTFPFVHHLKGNCADDECAAY